MRGSLIHLQRSLLVPNGTLIVLNQRPQGKTTCLSKASVPRKQRQAFVVSNAASISSESSSDGTISEPEALAASMSGLIGGSEGSAVAEICGEHTFEDVELGIFRDLSKTIRECAIGAYGIAAVILVLTISQVRF